MKYYLHDSNSFNDEKIYRLFMEYGYEGLGLFYTFLEKIAIHEKPMDEKVMKSQLKIRKKLEKVWDFMKEIDLISSQNGEVFNINLLNFAENYQIKKEKTRKRVSDWRETQKDKENVTSYERVSNTPKVKLSKVNKEIDKELSDKYEKFILFFNEKTGKRFKGDIVSRKQFNARLKDGFNGDDFRIAIENMMLDKYLKENTRFITPMYITRVSIFEKQLNAILQKKKSDPKNKDTWTIHDDIDG